jgi:putative nucleotidyltransferase with HDIG domain
MSATSIKAYVSLMCTLALVALGLTDWGLLTGLSKEHVLGLAALLGMGVLSEALSIRWTVGKRAGNTSITFIPLLASVQLFGPPAAVVLMFVTGTVGEFLIRRKDLERGLFNIAQWTASTFVAGIAFEVLGGVALEPSLGGAAPADFVGQLVPFVAFGIVFLALNHAAVSLAIALHQRLRFVEVWGQVLGHSGGKIQDLLISPVAIVVAFLYVQLRITGILVVLLPLLFIRQSYWRASRLRDANQDLLKVLIKAIETRDPYTSGHSLRVSHLAKRIAEVMTLPRGAIERIEQAALLHDIGKIEAVYTGILAKPDTLTPEERTVIQSHVTKGEELLRNLSSFPEEVIRAVRHHHEREDGNGYPDGLPGPEIPLGSKIISVCDAVDAMLSDRPYRRALSVRKVTDELERHRGSQFDPRVVDALMESRLITEYADMMRATRANGPPDSAAVLPITVGQRQSMRRGELPFPAGRLAGR